MSSLSSRAKRGISFIVLVFSFHHSLFAQTRPGSITGVVKDSLGKPIPNVEVTALRVAKTVRTDTAGHFLLGALPSGTLDIAFRRLAFEPVIMIITVPPADTADVEVTLGLAAQKLTAVVVQAHADQARILAGFEARRKQGIGQFITRAQIEDRHPFLLSDMVRRLPGAIVASTDGRTALRFARAPHANCPPQFFVDGIQTDGFGIDDLPPSDIEGMELYAGSAGLPPEFNRMHGTTICGTVIIWTRVPGAAKADTTKP
jgi:hypothetical protein